MPPKVSLIIPIHNVEKYLRQCLDSVVNQTLREIEIICIDDGSTDASPSILAEYAGRDARLKVIPQAKANAGHARNVGLAAASGDYVGFLDADDYCEEGLFEQAYAQAVSQDADMVIWAHNLCDMSSGEPILTGDVVLPRAFNRNHAILDYAYAPWNRLVRREMIAQKDLRFQEIERANDVYFGCMTLLHARKVVHLEGVQYHYRVGMTTNLQATNARTPDTVVLAWREVWRRCEADHLTEKYEAVLRTAAATSLFYTLQSIRDVDAYRLLWGLLKSLFQGDEFPGGTAVDQIMNERTRQLLALLSRSQTMTEFLVNQQVLSNSRYSRIWREKEKIASDLEESRRVRRSLCGDLDSLKGRLAESQKARRYNWQEARRLAEELAESQKARQYNWQEARRLAEELAASQKARQYNWQEARRLAEELAASQKARQYNWQEARRLAEELAASQKARQYNWREAQRLAGELAEIRASRSYRLGKWLARAFRRIARVAKIFQR